MNERIAELIRLSAVPADQVTAYAESKGLVETTEKLDVAKFVELIVRECSNIACEYDAPKMSGPGMIIAGRIEQHFGVEE